MMRQQRGNSQHICDALGGIAIESQDPEGRAEAVKLKEPLKMLWRQCLFQSMMKVSQTKSMQNQDLQNQSKEGQDISDLQFGDGHNRNRK